MHITNASLFRGGGTLFQWQNLPEFVAPTVAEERQKTLKMSRDGTLKHNYDPGCWHLVPIAH